MIRHVSAVALALALAPASAAAQTTVLTINTTQADVRTSPSMASVVVGEAPRGSVLEVTREVGDWVKVAWPKAPDGIGYVRLSAGSLSKGTPASAGPAPVAPPRTAATPGSTPAMDVRADVQDVERRIYAHAQAAEYVMPPTNRIGFGGLMSGSTIGFGVSGRAWTRHGLGVQAEMSRYSVATAVTASRVVSFQFAPSVLYSLPEAVSDYVRLRPYVGGGPRLWNSSFHPDGALGVSETHHSWQVFGGTELTMASAPRFAFSVDLRYDSSDTPVAGITFGGLGFTASGHWYVR